MNFTCIKHAKNVLLNVSCDIHCESLITFGKIIKRLIQFTWLSSFLYFMRFSLSYQSLCMHHFYQIDNFFDSLLKFWNGASFIECHLRGLKTNIAVLFFIKLCYDWFSSVTSMKKPMMENSWLSSVKRKFIQILEIFMNFFFKKWKKKFKLQ